MAAVLRRRRQEEVVVLAEIRVGAEFCLEAFEETHARLGEMCLDVPPQSASLVTAPEALVYGLDLGHLRC